VVLVVIVAVAVSFWNLFGNDVACRLSDALASFEDAKRPASTQCLDAAASSTGSGAGKTSRGGAASAPGRAGAGGSRAGAGSGRAGAGAAPHAGGAARAPAAEPPSTPASAAPAPPAPAPSPTPSPPSSPSSPPSVPSIGERIENGLAAVGRHAVDFTEGVIAGANPLTPLIPVELEPTFGNQVTYGAGEVVGSLVGLLDDAGNVVAGGTGMVASTAVLVLSDGTLVWVALPGFGASTSLAAVGVAGAAGHGTNLMQGIDDLVHGENAPSKPRESTQGSSSPEKPPTANEKPPAAEHPKAPEQPRAAEPEPAGAKTQRPSEQGAQAQPAGEKPPSAGNRRAPAADNYRGRYNASRAAEGKSRLPDDWDAHHRIPQEYRGKPEFKDFDFDAPSNIQGVQGSRSDANIHQQITNLWADFRSTHGNATRAEVEAFARDIDVRFQHYWWP